MLSVLDIDRNIGKNYGLDVIWIIYLTLCASDKCNPDYYYFFFKASVVREKDLLAFNSLYPHHHHRLRTCLSLISDCMHIL